MTKNQTLMLQMRVNWHKQVNIVLQEILDLNYFFDLFVETQKIIEGNTELKNIESHFWRSYNYAFISLILSQTRKQIKGKDTISLKALLESILKHPKFITREYYVDTRVAHWKEVHKSIPKEIEEQFFKRAHEEGEKSFLDLCGTGGFIDENIINSDISILNVEFKELTDFCDKMLIHRDTKILPEEYKTWSSEKLKKYIDPLSNMAAKYYKIITGETTGLKAELGEEWKDIFKIPWINS